MRSISLFIPAIAATLVGCATPHVDTLSEAGGLDRFRSVEVESVQIAPELANRLPDKERVSLERDLGIALKEGLASRSTDIENAQDAMRVQLTIANVNPSNVTLNWFTTALLFVPFDAGGIAFDARFYDGENPVPFAQSHFERTSTPLQLKGSFSRYGHAENSLRQWAEELKAKLAPVSSLRSAD